MSVGGTVAVGPEQPLGQGRRTRRGSGLLAPALVLLAMPLLRPNLLGEKVAVVGLALVAGAVVLTVLRRDETQARGELVPARRAWVLIGLLAAAYLWNLLRDAALGDTLDGFDTLQDVVLTVGATVGVAIVCRDARSARRLARGVVVVIVALCASYAVTAALWAVFGVGAAQIGTVPVGDLEPQPLYFPLTVSYSDQTVLGVPLPRFTGLGRESGWMAMYCAAAYFLAPAVGLRRWWSSILLVVGLIGCLSTAGFGVFVVVWAFDLFVRPRVAGIRLGTYLRQLTGLVVVGLAAWVAVAAPVLGLAAKRTQNEISLDERSRATTRGLEALGTDPWGHSGSGDQLGGVNLVADIASNGLPFVVLVLAALLVPVALVGAAGASTSVIVVVVLTLLLAQPAAASSWVFCLVVIALAVDDARASSAGTLTPQEGLR